MTWPGKGLVLPRSEGGANWNGFRPRADPRRSVWFEEGANSPGFIYNMSKLQESAQRQRSRLQEVLPLATDEVLLGGQAGILRCV